MDRSQLFLARRYAQAYLAAFYESLSDTSIVAFEAAELFFKKRQSACFLLDLSLLSSTSKTELLAEVTKKLKLPASCKELMKLVIAHHRASLLAAVFHQLTDLYKQQAGITTFVVQSSLALSQQEKTVIEDFLKEQVPGQIQCSYELNSGLIAGVRIFNEHYVWECSAQAQLRALHNSVGR